MGAGWRVSKVGALFRVPDDHTQVSRHHTCTHLRTFFTIYDHALFTETIVLRTTQLFIDSANYNDTKYQK